MEELINNVDGIILSFVQGSFSNLAGSVQVLWRMMFVVFVAVYGYKVMISGRFSASDLVSHCTKIIILFCLATQWDTFFLIIYNMVTDLPSDIAGQLLQTTSSSLAASSQISNETGAAAALSLFFDRGMKISAAVLQGAGWTDFGQYLYALAVWGGTIGVTGYAAMLIILAKLAVAILLAIGPVFILLLMFANTRALFEGWLRTLLNYALIPIFVYALLAILLALAENPLQHLENSSGIYEELISSIGPYLLICVISILLLAQVLNIAASVTGGVSLSTMGLAKWTNRTSTKTGAWTWRKTAPARAYAAEKIRTGAKTAVTAGQTALQTTLKRRQEVR